uniref:Uncharacterized protein n=2 Tax=Ciona savignyi TaxID=51511 RepID=H2ZPI5_CIOSA
MEFGSSHVYAGTEEVYYSSVPVSDDSIDKHKATNNTVQGQENLETVYEDFDNAETKINSNTNVVYNEVGEDESKSSGIYDEVVPDSAIKSKIKIKKKKKKKNPQKNADSIPSDFEADFTKAPPPKLENQYTVQPGLPASTTNPFYQALLDANAIQAALPTGVNLIDFVFDETNEYESTSDPADPAVPSPQLYPSLDKLIDPSTLSISPPITPTAPSLSAVNSLKRLEPSAPQFTQSMRLKDRNAVVNQNRAAEVAADPSYSSVDTNIVSVKLGIVGQ